MHAGKLVFAQLLEFAPWHTFRRLVAKFRGNFNVRSFSCLDQFLCMAFAQLTYRESLRDIEACLRAQPEKLYHMGIRGKVSRSALADANEERDWRIYYEFAQALIQMARELYAEESLGIELKETVYALDSTTIDLCLSMFEWASFRKTKAAVKLHTLLDLRGSIPTFIHISDGKPHDVNVLDLIEPELGAFYVMDRGYVDFQRLYKFVLAGSFFVTRAKSNFKYRKIKANPVDRTIGVLSDQVVELVGFYSRKSYPAQLRRIRYRDKEGRLLIFLTNNMTLPALTVCDLYRLRWQVELFFKWIKTAPADQTLLRHLGECRQNASLDCCKHLRACRHRSQAARSVAVLAYDASDPERHTVRETISAPTVEGRRCRGTNGKSRQPIEFAMKRVGQ